MTKELNIGIVGLGTVGSGVIKSIEKNKDYFKNNYDVVFNILGISANSKSKERSFNVSNYKWFDNPLDIISENNIDHTLVHSNTRPPLDTNSIFLTCAISLVGVGP